MRFVKHSALFGDTLAMILPISFVRRSRQSAMPPDFVLVYSRRLPHQTFTNARNRHGIKTVFQIWRKRSTPRPVWPRVSWPAGLTRVRYHQAWNLCVYRMGAPAQAGLAYLRAAAPEHLTRCAKSYLWYFSSETPEEHVRAMHSIRADLVCYFQDTSVTQLLTLNAQDFIRLLTGVPVSALTYEVKGKGKTTKKKSNGR